jgi:hypothetical protein
MGPMWKGGMWKVDTTHNSLITAGNGGSTPATVAFSLFAADGTSRYDFPDRTLQPGEQIWVDVGKVIQSQLPDKNGKTLPLGTAAGSYQIQDLDHPLIGYIFEGKLVLDKTYGHVGYGCARCCAKSVAQYDDPLGFFVGDGSAQWVAATDDCTGGSQDVTKYSYGWYSSNTSVVDVGYNGASTAMGPGTAEIDAFIDVVSDTMYADPCPTATMMPSAYVNVSPTITSISPAHGVSAANTQVTITGTGLAGATVQAGPGISVSISSSSSTQIQATFAIASNATNGQRQVTATNNGAISNAVNFLVQVPTSLDVVSDTGSVQDVSCTVSGSTYNGVRRDILYRVMDANVQPILTSGMSLTESFQAGTNSCTGTPNTPTPTVNAPSDSLGQFPNVDRLAICSVACLPANSSGNPTGSCTLSVTQTWTANGFTVRTNQIAYHCSSVAVTPQ